METLEEFRRKNPDVAISQYDLRLAGQDPRFAQDLVTAKTLAKEAGNDGALMSQAHELLEKSRAQYGSYSGGQDGSQYLPDGLLNAGNAYAKLEEQLGGAAQLAGSAYQEQADALRGYQEDLRLQAQQQKEDVTSGYFKSLEQLRERQANQGYSPLGGQSRTEQAAALSESYRLRQQADSALREALTQTQLKIGELLAKGKSEQAQQLYENAKLLMQERQNALDSALKKQQLDDAWAQNQAKNQLSEGELLGVYRGQDTLGARKLREDSRQFDAQLGEKQRKFDRELAEKQRQADAKLALEWEKARQRKASSAKTAQEKLPEERQKTLQAAVQEAMRLTEARRKELLKKDLPQSEAEYQSWEAAFEYLDGSMGPEEGSMAFTMLEVPQSYVERYLRTTYGGRRSGGAQPQTPGELLYDLWGLGK